MMLAVLAHLVMRSLGLVMKMMMVPNANPKKKHPNLPPGEVNSANQVWAEGTTPWTGELPMVCSCLSPCVCWDRL